MPTKDAPLAVEVPAPAQDKPAWVKVGVIAAVGFIVGIAWPRAFGVRIGPSAPGEAAATAASASAQHGRAPEAPPASVAAKSTISSPTTTASAPAIASVTPTAVPPTISLQKGTVLSCKTSDGETKKGKDCGAVAGIDQLVFPRVKKIATCSGVEGQTGKLSLVVNVDFDTKRFWYDVGKTSALPNIDAVSSCLKTSFHGTSAVGTPHEHPRYTVAYVATFAPGTRDADDDKPTGAAHKDKDKDKDKKAKDTDDRPAPESESKEPPPSSPSNNGEAQVAWEVALVRDAPKTGGLVSRLPRGTKVKVGATRDGWYQVKFGEAFDKEGWVYRGAIGR